jgi:hypothetical protein
MEKQVTPTQTRCHVCEWPIYTGHECPVRVVKNPEGQEVIFYCSPECYADPHRTHRPGAVS